MLSWCYPNENHAENELASHYKGTFDFAVGKLRSLRLSRRHPGLLDKIEGVWKR